jgi:hypothetical protein
VRRGVLVGAGPHQGDVRLGEPTANAGKPPVSAAPRHGSALVAERSAERSGLAHGAFAGDPGKDLPSPQWHPREVGGESLSQNRSPRLVEGQWRATSRAVIPPSDPAIAAPDIAYP